jgi:Uma2 family endonuclease
MRWNNIPREPSGRIANRFVSPPDWAIEILSLDQSTTFVLENLLKCSEYGTEVGWLIDPKAETVLLVLPEQRVKLFRGETALPVLADIDLILTPAQVFDWLSF